MGILLVGHGGLHSPSSDAYQQDMGAIAVPPGVRLQFFSEMTQIGFDNAYEDWARDWMFRWDQIKASPPFPPLTDKHTTYNLTLMPLFGGDGEKAARFIEFAKELMPKETVYLADIEGPIVMCDGTPDTCPTDPRSKAPHRCTGILGTYTGDLYWLACTSVVGLESRANPTHNDDEYSEPTDEAEERWRSDWSDARGALRGGGKYDWNYYGDDPDNIVHFAERFLAYEGEEDFKALFYPGLTGAQRNMLFANQAMAAHLNRLGLGTSPDDFALQLDPAAAVQYYTDALVSDPNSIDIVKASIRGQGIDTVIAVCQDAVLSALLDNWNPTQDGTSNPQLEDRFRQIKVQNAVYKLLSFLAEGDRESVMYELGELEKTDRDCYLAVCADNELTRQLGVTAMDED